MIRIYPLLVRQMIDQSGMCPRAAYSSAPLRWWPPRGAWPLTEAVPRLYLRPDHAGGACQHSGCLAPTSVLAASPPAPWVPVSKMPEVMIFRRKDDHHQRILKSAETIWIASSTNAWGHLCHLKPHGSHGNGGLQAQPVSVLTPGLERELPGS